MRKLFSFLLGFICVINASVASTSDDIAIFIEPDVIEHAIREYFSDNSDGKWVPEIGRVPNNFEQIVLDAHDNLNYCILNTPDNLLASGCIVNFCRDVMGSVMAQDSAIVTTARAATYCKAFAARLIELEICIQEKIVVELPEDLPEDDPINSEPDPVSEPEQKSDPVSEPEQKSDPVSEPEQKSEPVSEPEQKSDPVSDPICIEKTYSKDNCDYSIAKVGGQQSYISYTDTNKSGFVRIKGPLAWRFNNPGNVSKSGFQCALIEIKQTIKGKTILRDFSAFDSYERGRAAKRFLLRNACPAVAETTLQNLWDLGYPSSKRSFCYRELDILAAIHMYAPKSDNNNPVSYANGIKKTLVSKYPDMAEQVNGKRKVDTIKIKDLTDEQLNVMMDAMEQREGFTTRAANLKRYLYTFNASDIPITLAKCDANGQFVDHTHK